MEYSIKHPVHTIHSQMALWNPWYRLPQIILTMAQDSNEDLYWALLNYKAISISLNIPIPFELMPNRKPIPSFPSSHITKQYKQFFWEKEGNIGKVLQQTCGSPLPSLFKDLPFWIQLPDGKQWIPGYVIGIAEEPNSYLGYTKNMSKYRCTRKMQRPRIMKDPKEFLTTLSEYTNNMSPEGQKIPSGIQQGKPFYST